LKTDAATRQFIRPGVTIHFGDIKLAPAFEQQNIGSGGSQFFRLKAACRAGTDDQHIIDFTFWDFGILRFGRFISLFCLLAGWLDSRQLGL
jgi:hypothetical protein